MAPVGIGKLTSIQRLSLIKASGDGHGTLIRELGNLTQLRKLGIVDLKEQDGKLLCESIGRMTDLRSLEVASFTEEASSVREKALIPEKHSLDLTKLTIQHPNQLQSLHLKGCLNRLPAWVSSLHDLVKMRLKFSKLSTSPIYTIQDLPHLTELQLLDAYSGAQLVFPPRKFRSLRILELGNLIALELLSMQGGALPSLQKLTLTRLPSMKQVPDGIDQQATLQELILTDLPEKVIFALLKKQDFLKRIPIALYLSLDGGGKLQRRDLTGRTEEKAC